MRVWLLAMLAGYVGIATPVAAQGTSDGSRKQRAVEYQSPYGFCFSLPEDWRGFSIVKEHWDGFAPCSKGDCVITQGPLVRIQNPRCREPNSCQDIPIMVFTQSSGNLLANSTSAQLLFHRASSDATESTCSRFLRGITTAFWTDGSK